MFLIFDMLGTSYTHRGLLCGVLLSRNVDREYDLCKSLPDYRASRDTNIHFSFVVKQVIIFFYFGILNDGLISPTKGVEGIVFV